MAYQWHGGCFRFSYFFLAADAAASAAAIAAAAATAAAAVEIVFVLPLHAGGFRFSYFLCCFSVISQPRWEWPRWGSGCCIITCVYSNAYMYKSESNSPLKVIDWWADHCALSGSAHEHAKGRQWRNQQFPSKVTDCWADHCALSCSSDH